MKLERIKSFVLFLLITSSIVLASQIWFNEKLWPDGYDFSSIMQNTTIGRFFLGLTGEGETKETVQEDILVPYNFFVYMVKDSDHAGYMLTPKDESFSDAKNFLHEFMGKTLSGVNESNFSKVEESAWQSALCADGIYLDYGAAYLTDTFLQLVNVVSDADILKQNINKMGRFALTYEDDKINLYINDLADNSFYKIACNTESEKLSEIITGCREDATVYNRFSFFIGADIAAPIEGTAVFAPYIVLSEGNVDALTATSESLENINSKMLSEAENIAEIFSINPKTARRYADAQENTVLVQNQSSVKFTKQGYIEYVATTANGGLALLENADSNTPLALVLYPLVFLAERINQNIAENSNISVYVSSVSEDNGKYTVTLDYSFNGFTYVATDGKTPISSVTAEIEGGHLKSYKQYIADLEVTEEIITLPSSYEGIDSIFAHLALEERKKLINDMFIGYIDIDGNVIPKWFIRSGDSYTIFH